jgi:uroporphyrinogen III methyltransferase/synthase
VVTRPRAQAAALVEALKEAGHEPVVCPLIAIEPLGDDPIDTSGYDWVVVTSANGANELARRRSGELRRVAAVGPATADALRAHGIDPVLVPREPSQDGLLAELPRPAGRVLLAAAEGARRLLVDELGADFVPLYRTVELRPATPSGDVAVLASPSAARAFAALGVKMLVVTIGPHTSREARAQGLEIAAEAERPDAAAVVAAIGTLPRSSPRDSSRS